jgi:hypothetical protein
MKFLQFFFKLYAKATERQTAIFYFVCAAISSVIYGMIYPTLLSGKIVPHLIVGAGMFVFFSVCGLAGYFFANNLPIS